MSVFIQIQKSFFQQVFLPNVLGKLKMVYTVEEHINIL